MRLGPMLALAIAAVGLALTAAPEAALGAQFTVDSTTDAVDANPGDGICASAAGECTLRAAIQETNALPGADEVTLPGGTYALEIPGEGEDAAATGDLDVTDDFTLVGRRVEICSSPETCIPNSYIDGAALDRAIDIASGIEADISALEFFNGSALTSVGGPHGGAIRNAGTLRLHNAGVHHNVASRGAGVSNSGTLSVESVRIEHNQAQSQAGGLLNEAGGNVRILHSFVWNNFVNLGSGGGVTNAGALSVEKSVIAVNYATEFGGGIENYPAGAATVANSTISDNSAHGGGGVFNAGGGETDLTNVTIAHNVSPLASSIMNDGVVRMRNSMLVTTRGAPVCSSPVTSLGHNLSTDGSCGLNATGDKQVFDPRIGPATDNGGFTITNALFPDSPAVDAADNTACPPTDQRGFPRPQDGNGDGTSVCDIGAYELTDQPIQATPTPSPSPTPRTLPDTGRGQASRSGWPVPVAAAALVSVVILGVVARRLRRWR